MNPVEGGGDFKSLVKSKLAGSMFQVFFGIRLHSPKKKCPKGLYALETDKA